MDAFRVKDGYAGAANEAGREQRNHQTRAFEGYGLHGISPVG
jgi:hypothetical protein